MKNYFSPVWLGMDPFSYQLLDGTVIPGGFVPLFGYYHNGTGNCTVFDPIALTLFESHCHSKYKFACETKPGLLLLTLIDAIRMQLKVNTYSIDNLN